MNLLLSVVISVSVVLAMALIAIFSKKRNAIGKAAVVMLLAAVTAFGSSTFVYAEGDEAAKQPQALAGEVNYSAPESKSLTMIYAFIAKGDYDEAKSMLDEFESTTMYTGDYALCRARLAALNNDYKAARLLYEKSEKSLSSGDVGNEYATVCDCLLDTQFDSALYGASTDYKAPIDNAGEIAKKAKKARANLKDVVLDSVDNELDGKSDDEYLDAVEMIQKIDSLYENYLSNYGYYFDSYQLKDLIETAEELAENDDISAEPSFRMARIKLFIMDRDYEGFVESLNEKSDYHELLVVTELYINGYIEEDDFAKKYGSERIKMYEKVCDHLEDLNKNVYSGKDFRSEVSDFLDEMEERMDHPALTMVEDTLLNYADDINVEDRTKIYLELAKYELHNGDKVQTNQHLTNALNMVTDCTDPVYMDAMCELVSIINDKDNPQAMMNLATYVDDVSKNSTTVKLAESLMQKNPEKNWDDDDNYYVDDDDDNEDSEKKDEDVSFDNYLSDYVSKKRTSLNILNVDTSKFSTVSFDLAVDSEIAYSAEQLKELLKISDCGVNISNFKVEDITYSTVNMVLVCDQSGSMSGTPIQDLKSAVSMFLNNKTATENIGLITFDSYVSGCYGLDTSVEELNRVVNNIYAGGGTNIYDAVVAATSMVTGKKDALNVIIVLSDGQDGYYHSPDEIYSTVVEPCLENNTLVYSLGLGSGVDSVYLDSYASPTGGSYLHIVNSATLSSFYDYLHSMVLNRYRVTFTAEDTLHYTRTLKVQSKEDDLAYDTFKYKLGDDSSGEDTEGNSNVVYRNKYVSGLSVKFLYDTNEDQVIQLLGKGFTSSDSIEIKLIGKIDYNVSAKYVSETQFDVTIPGNILDGTYDMQVILNGMEGIYYNELTIGDEMQITVFGPYKFTSVIKEEKDDGVTVLDGYVSLNDWLYFKGKVELLGNLENSSSITLMEEDGSYVKFAPDAEGLAKTYIESNKAFELDAFTRITLYNNATNDPNSLSYEVDETIFTEIFVDGLMNASAPRVSLYPNFVKVRFDSFSTDFPLQEEILKAVVKADSFFKFEASSDLLVSAKNIGTRMEMSYGESGDNRNYRYGNLGNMKIGVSPNDVGYIIDTYNGIYNIKFVVKFDFMNLDGVGLELEWTDDLKMKKIWANIDHEIQTSISGVPLSFSDFWFGADDIDSTQPFYLWTLRGEMDVEVADVTEIIPSLDKYMDEIPLLALEDTGVEFAFGKGYLKLDTKCKLLGDIDLGEIEIVAGKMSYTNAMLGMYNETAAGLMANVKVNLDFDIAILEGSLGGDAQLSITNRFVGMTVGGHIRLQAHLWIAEPEIALDGNLLLGVVTETDGDIVFTVRARGNAGSNGGSFRLDFQHNRFPLIEFKSF